MSLQYIIDGCNLASNPAFASVCRRGKDSRVSLIETIINHRLCGSLNNGIIVIFDGYPMPGGCGLRENSSTLRVFFSQEASADDKIKTLVQNSRQPKNIVVVSDDKEIVLFSRSLGSKVLSVAEFARPILGGKGKTVEDLSKVEPSSMQAELINRELRKRWLGGGER